MGRIPTTLAVLLLAVVFAANVYRARTQSFTADEALTYNNYVSAPLRATLTDFDANNHVLNTLLEKVSAALFGASEFTLRLPSLAGGALYLAAVFLLCRRLFGQGAMLIVSVAALALNPLVLDYLSAARGYGMALGLFLWAVEFLLRYFDQARPEHLYRASLALGLSVAANLTLAFPGVALVSLCGAVLVRRREWGALADQFLLPGFLAAFILLAIPLSHARGGHFYIGTQSLAQALDGVVRPSLYHDSSSLPEPEQPLRHWLYRSSLRLVPAVLALCVPVLGWLGWRRRRAPWPAEQRLFALCAGTLAGSILLVVAAHARLGLPYPEGRTGLYLIPLFCLTAFALMRMAARNRWAARTLVPAAAVFFSLCAIQFARQWNTKYYLEWRFDSRTKEIVRMIDGLRDRSRASVSVSVTWPVAATVDFYRRTRQLEWLDLKHRHVDKTPAEYYILTGEDLQLAEKLEVVFRDDFAEVVLARATAPPVRP
ncbi:MAG: glycosyltransferase family 39 protein [Acidobacteriota bacterium]